MRQGNRPDGTRHSSNDDYYDIRGNLPLKHLCMYRNNFFICLSAIYNFTLALSAVSIAHQFRQLLLVCAGSASIATTKQIINLGRRVKLVYFSMQLPCF